LAGAAGHRVAPFEKVARNSSIVERGNRKRAERVFDLRNLLQIVELTTLA
jgi:hypothetical protein